MSRLNSMIFSKFHMDGKFQKLIDCICREFKTAQSRWSNRFNQWLVATMKDLPVCPRKGLSKLYQCAFGEKTAPRLTVHGFPHWSKTDSKPPNQENARLSKMNQLPIIYQERFTFDRYHVPLYNGPFFSKFSKF